ncbi:hypothetical protein F933_02801 [Acinetobacter beijerinckii CIP 110307]|uniref:Uncharacterized protein n=1 Tax=Acinetobacter beijerinckii CIP 110307 TaxID=1217648 RepID=N9FG01_9GAMM|nr:hypothetical protein F933_02801 [Acinetobacter beijerinckii CIP 110307]
MLKSFHFKYKQRDFYRDIDRNKYSCYKVKYIEVGYSFFKKFFIYDYLGLIY